MDTVIRGIIKFICFSSVILADLFLGGRGTCLANLSCHFSILSFRPFLPQADVHAHTHSNTNIPQHAGLVAPLCDLFSHCSITTSCSKPFTAAIQRQQSHAHALKRRRRRGKKTSCSLFQPIKSHLGSEEVRRRSLKNHNYFLIHLSWGSVFFYYFLWNTHVFPLCKWVIWKIWVAR